MKILLLGGAGFIGLNLAAALLRHGHEVHLVSRSDLPKPFGQALPVVTGFHVVPGNDTDRLLSIIDALGIDCVIGLVSGLMPSSSFNDFEVELTQVMAPTFRLIEELARRQVRFAYVSSGGTVYGASAHPTLDESAPLRPINHYGCSKVFVEQYVEFIGRTRGLRHLILRPSNPFGPFQNPHRKQGLIAVAVDKILHGQPIDIWGDGSVVRDYLWVEDLADVVARLLSVEAAWGRIFNIGAGTGHSINELLAVIQELTGRAADIRYREGRAVDVPRMVLDISRLRQVLPFEPLDLRRALSSYLNDLRS